MACIAIATLNLIMAHKQYLATMNRSKIKFSHHYQSSKINQIPPSPRCCKYCVEFKRRYLAMGSFLLVTHLYFAFITRLKDWQVQIAYLHFPHISQACFKPRPPQLPLGQVGGCVWLEEIGTSFFINGITRRPWNKGKLHDVSQTWLEELTDCQVPR